MIKLEPLKNKAMNFNGMEILFPEDVASAVTWLKQREIGKEASALLKDANGVDYVVFKREDFNEAFHDVAHILNQQNKTRKEAEKTSEKT